LGKTTEVNSVKTPCRLVRIKTPAANLIWFKNIDLDLIGNG
jgi:hypothetical protein